MGTSSVCWSMSMFDDDDVEGGAVAMLCCCFDIVFNFCNIVSSDDLGDFSCPEAEREPIDSSGGRDSSDYFR